MQHHRPQYVNKPFQDQERRKLSAAQYLQIIAAELKAVEAEQRARMNNAPLKRREV